ncbi:hypothetical protein, partial [Microcoleus sp. OTE_8_concoct_300]|uniref:hypothetical protein n=1 Tax=Microcoleus sp. OTE_8_concoct_300 TaxID=2964710 RepID=UPI00403FB586
KCRGGNLSIVGAIDDSTAKEILHTLHRAAKTPTPLVTACVGVGVCHLWWESSGRKKDELLSQSPLPKAAES